MSNLKQKFLMVGVLYALLLLLINITFHSEMAKPRMTTETHFVQNKCIGIEAPTPEIEFEEIVYDPLLNATKTEIDLPDNPKYRGTKSYEYYTAITSKRSKQYKIQGYAITDDKGFRTVNGRYLIAVGTFFNAPVGTYLDVILENGLEIPCVVGDIKADKDTDATNVFSRCGCASEFMVDKSFVSLTGCRGDVSKVMEGWNSKVKTIRVYDYNFFNSITE